MKNGNLAAMLFAAGLGIFGGSCSGRIPGGRKPDHPGQYEINITPVPYGKEVGRKVKQYLDEHPDIGVRPRIEKGEVTGFYIWPKKNGAGYSWMGEDIERLAR